MDCLRNEPQLWPVDRTQALQEVKYFFPVLWEDCQRFLDFLHVNSVLPPSGTPEIGPSYFWKANRALICYLKISCFWQVTRGPLPLNAGNHSTGEEEAQRNNSYRILVKEIAFPSSAPIEGSSRISVWNLCSQWNHELKAPWLYLRDWIEVDLIIFGT